MRVSGLYSGLKYNVYSMSSDHWIDIIDADLNNLVLSNQQDAVVSIVMFPLAYINYDIDEDDGSIVVGEAPYQHTQTIVAPTKIGDYTPRNKKLLTFPYTFLTVDTLNSSHNYKYEYFENRNDIEFAEIGCISPNPEIIVAPKYYNGAKAVSDSVVINTTESLTCAGFPQCAFVIDSYRAWIAQKSTDYSLAQTQNLVRTVASAGNMIASLGTNISANANYANNLLQMERDSNSALLEQSAGSKTRGTSGDSANVASKSKGIYYKYMSITEQFARRIDDFFDRFGYSSGRIKIPNRNVRPHWTYTKTVDVAIRGSVPVDDMRKIKSIYNNGITFWKYGSEVGNYSLNNSV